MCSPGNTPSVCIVHRDFPMGISHGYSNPKHVKCHIIICSVDQNNICALAVLAISPCPRQGQKLITAIKLSK